MGQRARRRYCTAAESAEIWDRWKRGENLTTRRARLAPRCSRACTSNAGCGEESAGVTSALRLRCKPFFDVITFDT